MFWGRFPEKTITVKSPSCEPFNFKLGGGNFEKKKMGIPMLWEVALSSLFKFSKNVSQSLHGKSIEKAVSFTFLLYCIVKHHFISFSFE